MNFIKKALLVLLLCLSVVRAEAKDSFIPDQIYKSDSAPTYNSSTYQELGIIPSKTPAASQTYFEYGVAKAIQDGPMTSFEILTTETTTDISSNTLKVKIPNTIGDSASTTYVMYVKSMRPHDPDSENFFVTKKFGIISGTDPFVQMKVANLLQSTGARYGLAEGPFLYDPSIKSDITLATSTSLEMIFESNQDVVLHPKITFSKLRSDVAVPSMTAPDIMVKKGQQTYARISLPLFNYEPGVYTGTVDFGNSILSTKVNFQYIIAGDIVTIGQTRYLPIESGNRVEFDIFNTPVDQDLLTSTSSVGTTTANYTVVAMFKKGNSIVYTSTSTVDFAQTNFHIDIPGSIRNIDTVDLQVISKEGKTVYVGQKSVGIHTNIPILYLYSLYGFLMLLLLLLLWKRMFKTAIVLVVLSIGILWFTSSIQADVWNPRTPVNYRTSGSSAISVYLNSNPTTPTYTCGEEVSVMVRSVFGGCSNQSFGVAIGFSTSSVADAKSKAVVQNRNFAGSTAYKTKGAASSYYNSYAASHPGFAITSTYCHTNSKDKTHCGVYFSYTSPFVQYTIGKITDKDKKLYMSAVQTTSEASTLTAGYEFPITVGACTACSNAPQAQNTANFQNNGRNYYYDATNQKLYYKTIIDTAAGSTVCTLDMCGDTQADESAIPAGKQWNSSASVNSLSRFTCGDTNVQCNCSNRDLVCTNAVTGTSSTQTGSASCEVQPYCSTQYNSPSNTATVTFGAANIIGTASYNPTGNSTTVAVSSTSDIVVTKTITDSFDSQARSTSCTVPKTTGCSCSGSDYVCSDSIITNYPQCVAESFNVPTIVSFKSSPNVVHKGQTCNFSWVSAHMKSCTLDGNPVDTSSGVVYSLPTLDGNNIVKNLTCISSTTPAQTFSTTTTCYVNPTVQEK